MSVITIERKVLEKNDEVARQNRALFQRHGIFAINIVSSPGAGKTTLLERTLEHLRGRLKLAVIEGDVQTDLDAQRVAKYNVPAVQIVTRGGCHLEANLVHEALQESRPLDIRTPRSSRTSGNLVCPVELRSRRGHEGRRRQHHRRGRQAPEISRNVPECLGTHASTRSISSRTSMPSSAVLRANALCINPSLTVFETSATTGEGLDAWCAWLSQHATPRSR